MSGAQARWATGAAWVVLALSLWGVASWWLVVDDAWISFRYARNLAEGRGLVFNPGEQPPVEGYSNLFWVLIAAAGLAVGVAPDVGMPALSALCGVGLVVGVGWVARHRLGATGAQAVLAMALVGLAPWHLVWSTGGLATMPAALALAALGEAWLLADDRRAAWRGAAAGALLMGLRTEGVAWVVVVGVLALVVGGRGSRRRLVGPGVALALVFGGLLAFRLGYHEAWVSNTASAKLSLSVGTLRRGLRYALGQGLADPGRLAVLALATAGLAWRRDRVALAVVAMAWAPWAYAVAVGGDFMAFGRLLVPALPFMAWGVVLAVRSRPALGVLAWVAVGAGGLALVDVHPVPRAVRASLDVRQNTPAYRTEVEQWRFMRRNVRRWRQIGLALDQVAPEGASLVMGAVGAVGYHAPRLHLFDRFGLVSPEVLDDDPGGRTVRASPGHDRAVPVSFFLDQDPTYVGAWVARRGGLRSLPELVEGRRAEIPEDRYAPSMHRVDLEGEGAWLVVLERTDDAAARWAAWERRVPGLLRGRPGRGGAGVGGRSAPPRGVGGRAPGYGAGPGR